jgi:hypothetical protein
MESTVGGVRSTTSSPAMAEVTADGWLLFAAIMIWFTGIWNVFEGIFAFFRSGFFAGGLLFGSLWIWAVLWIAFGVLLMAAGSAILAGRSWARVFGIVIVGLSAYLHLLSIPAYPFWSLVLVSLDVLIIYGLAAHWSRPAAGQMA